MQPDVIDLFPSTVLRFRHDDSEIRDELEKVIIDVQEKEQLILHFGDDPSKQDHWRDFFRAYEMPNLESYIAECVIKYVGHDNWNIPESWLNIYPTGANQNQHMHPGFELSGCYYHKTSPEQGLINFHSPLVQARMSCFATYQEMAVETFPDTLILFPSWLEHSTTQNYSRDQKYSIGFNVKVNKTGDFPLHGQWYGNHTIVHNKN